MYVGISLPQISPPFNVCFGGMGNGLAAEQKTGKKVKFSSKKG